MKRIVLLLVFAISILSLSAKVVRPVKYNWTVDNIPDGEYYVDVDWKSVKPAKDGCYLTFDIILYDRYTTAMLENLAVGDYIYFDSKTVKVLNKKIEDGLYVINYEDGAQYSGIIFSDQYEEGYLTPCMEPDYVSQSSYGKVTLKVNKFRATYDHGKIDEVKGAGISNYITKKRTKQAFRNLNAGSIVVKNGKVFLFEIWASS